jgi:hypothetical protein
MLRDELLVGLPRVRTCGGAPILVFRELQQAFTSCRHMATVGMLVAAACAERQSLVSRLQPASASSESATKVTRERLYMVIL